MISEILKLLSSTRFDTSNEKLVQVAVEKLFTANGIKFSREKTISKGSIIDFLCGDTGIELKIKGNKNYIYKQLDRYSKFEEIHALILLTSKSMGLPEEINGKQLYVVNMSKAWL